MWQYVESIEPIRSKYCNASCLHVSSASPTPETREIEHAFGKTMIPADPKRIASINLEDILLSLEVPLVFGMSIGEGYYLNDRLAAQNIVSEIWGEQLNMEAILASQPDLIIASSAITPNDYEQLSKIAPTLAYDREDWKNTLPLIGEVLGTESQAEQVMKQYNNLADKAQQALQKANKADKSIAFIRMTGKDFRAYFPDYVNKDTGVEWHTYPGVLYHELGLPLDPTIAMWHKDEPNFQNVAVSFEALPELKADYIFVTLGGAGSTDDQIEQAKTAFDETAQSAVWKSIPAVKQNQVVFVNARHWISSGPIANQLKIDDVIAAFTSQ